MQDYKSLSTQLWFVPPCGNCTGCPCNNESNSRSLSWSSSVYLTIHWRICQTTVSSLLTTACANSAWPTRRCVLFDGHTPLALGVSQWLDHTCATHYLLNYNNVTVLESSNGWWKHTCSATTALCHILVKSDVYKSSYLLTYLVNTQTNTQTDNFWPVVLLAQPAELKWPFCIVRQKAGH